MPNIAVLIIMGMIFCISIVIGDRLAKIYPEYPYLPALGWVVGVLIILALYFIGKQF